MRVQRWRSLARRYGPWLLLGLLVGLLVAGGVWGWRAQQRSAAEQASTAYAQGVDLLQKGDTKGAEARFRTVADGGSKAYKSLALMQIGGIRLEANDPNAAAQRFDEAAAAAPDELLGDIARLKAVFVRMDTQPYPASIEQLQPLAAEGRPYRLAAMEALAIARIASGQAQAARSDLSLLTNSLDAPQGVRARAQGLLALIDSGAAGSLAATAKAAAALPPTPAPGVLSVPPAAAPAAPAASTSGAP